MKKSPDAFRTISEVAEALEVPPHVLRFWESRFSQIRPVKRAGGRRYYRPADIELLAGIRKLLHDDGMTIRGVQKRLREDGVRAVSDLAPTGAARPPQAEAAGEADANDTGTDTGIDTGTDSGSVGGPVAAAEDAAPDRHASPAAAGMTEDETGTGSDAVETAGADAEAPFAEDVPAGDGDRRVLPFTPRATPTGAAGAPTAAADEPPEPAPPARNTAPAAGNLVPSAAPATRSPPADAAGSGAGTASGAAGGAAEESRPRRPDNPEVPADPADNDPAFAAARLDLSRLKADPARLGPIYRRLVDIRRRRMAATRPPDSA